MTQENKTYLGEVIRLVEHKGIGFIKSEESECRRAQDAKRDIPVPLSPCARRQP